MNLIDLRRSVELAGAGREQKWARSSRPRGIPVSVVHPTTGEHLPAAAFLVLEGRAGDSSM